MIVLTQDGARRRGRRTTAHDGAGRTKAFRLALNSARRMQRMEDALAGGADVLIAESLINLSGLAHVGPLPCSLKLPIRSRLPLDMSLIG